MRHHRQVFVEGRFTEMAVHAVGAGQHLAEGVHTDFERYRQYATLVNKRPVVYEGQEVTAEIISVDREERKIGLSLKGVGDMDDVDTQSYLEKQGSATSTLGDVFGDQLRKGEDE